MQKNIRHGLWFLEEMSRKKSIDKDSREQFGLNAMHRMQCIVCNRLIVIAACHNLAIFNVFSLFAKINYESILSWKHSLLCDSATSFWILLLIQKIGNFWLGTGDWYGVRLHICLSFKIRKWLNDWLNFSRHVDLIQNELTMATLMHDVAFQRDNHILLSIYYELFINLKVICLN